MARRVSVFNSSFGGGEVDERVLHRTPTDLIRQSCKRIRNWAIVTGDGVARRPGSAQRDVVEADATRCERVRLVGPVPRALVISPGQVDIYDEDTWTKEDTVTGCPWGASDILTMGVSDLEDGVEIVSHSFFPQLLTRDSGGSWSIADVSFDQGSQGETLQPYYRYADKGVTMLPSGTSGSITLTTSAAHWTADHVGAIVRYHGKEILITAYTSPTVVTGTVQQTLFPTVTITVGSSAGFSVGQTIEGATSGRQGIITAVPSGNSITCILLGYDTFDTASSEKITSETGYTTVSGSAAATTAASTVWDEAMISDYAGYPGENFYHKKRHGYADFPSAPPWIAFSSVNEPYTFDLGTAALDDAVIDGLGDNPSARVRYVVSAEQLIVLTDQGAYYVPESNDLPISQTTIAFSRIGTEGAGDCRPVFTSDGVIYAAGSRVYAVTSTGNVRSSWAVQEVAEFASHLISDPIEIALANGLGTEPSRYLMVVNDDFSMAVLRYARNSEIVGWQLWHTSTSIAASKFYSIAALRGSTTAVCILGLGGSSDRHLCELSFDKLLDCEADYSSAVTDLADTTGMTLLKNGLAFATGEVDSSGYFVRDDNAETVTPAEGLSVGQDFTSEFIPVPPYAADFGAREMAISYVSARLINTKKLKINDEEFTSREYYEEAWNPSDGLPTFSWNQEVAYLDSGEISMLEPGIVFSQEEAAAATISAITYRVIRGDA